MRCHEITFFAISENREKEVGRGGNTSFAEIIYLNGHDHSQKMYSPADNIGEDQTERQRFQRVFPVDKENKPIPEFCHGRKQFLQFHVHPEKYWT